MEKFFYISAKKPINKIGVYKKRQKQRKIREGKRGEGNVGKEIYDAKLIMQKQI